MTHKPVAIDQTARSQALDPTKSFIVQAPAGSGKTELLVTRFVTLLAKVTNPEQIIAITFTIKAAQEMRHRVLESLSSSGTGIGLSTDLAKAAKLAAQQDFRMKWLLCENPSRLRIMTIDSFNRHLIRQATVSAAITQAEQISNDNSIYQQAAWRLLANLQEKASKVDSLDRVFRHFGCDGDNLENAIIKMLTMREQWLDLFTTMRSMTTEEARIWLNRQIQIEANHVNNRLQTALKPWLYPIVTIANQVIAYLNKDNKYYDAIETIATGLPTDLDKQENFWSALKFWLMTTKNTFVRKITKAHGFPPEGKSLKEQMLEILSELTHVEPVLQQQIPPSDYSSAQVITIIDFANTFVEAVAWLEIIFAEQGITDFSAISQAALDALGNDTEPAVIAETEYERIHHILIDEFQDTSIRQYELLRRLVRDWTPNQDNHSLFIVGDPRQSIYRFRQAEPSLFDRVWKHGIASIALETIKLQSNFRSHLDLVHWNNQTFKALFPIHPDLAIGETSFRESIAEIQNTTDHPVCLYLSTREEDPLSQQINNKLGQEILNLLSRNDIDSIAILIAKRKQAAPILYQLRKLHIAYNAIDIENFNQQQHILDLLSLAKALTNHEDSISWMALLRHPVLALSLADLLLLCEQQGTIWQAICNPPETLSDYGKNIIGQIHSALVPLNAKVYRCPWRQIIEDAWHCLAMSQHLDESAYWQCLSLLDSIEHYSQGTRIDFDKLVANLDQSRYTATVSGNNDIMTKNKPISIMTIHKAKGLEFDAVLLPGLEENLSSSSSRLPFLWDRLIRDQQNLLLLATNKAKDQNEQSKLYKYISNLENRRDLAEALRVLYVAFTRAKVCLRLFARTRESQLNNNGNSYVQWLLHKAKMPYKKLNPSDQQTTTTTTTNEQVNLLPVLIKSPLAQLPAAKRTEKNTEYLAIEKHQGHLIDKFNDQFPAKQGTEIHHMLEHPAVLDILEQLEHADQSYDQRLDQLKPIWQQTLRLRGIPYNYQRKIATSISTALTNIINDPIGRWIFNQKQANLELSLQTRDEHGKIITNIIDRTFVADGIRWIIDFKAVTARDEESEQELADRIKHQYRQQLDQYGLVFSRKEQKKIKLGLYLVMQPLWIHWDWNQPQ